MNIGDIPEDLEVEAVFSATSEQRRKYFFERIMYTGSVWLILIEENPLELKRENGGWTIPIWPFETYSKRYTDKFCRHFSKIEFFSQEIGQFLINANEFIEQEYSTISIFPGRNNTAIEYTVEELSNQIQKMKAEYTRIPKTL